jgi:hypothetical protein
MVDLPAFDWPDAPTAPPNIALFSLIPKGHCADASRDGTAEASARLELHNHGRGLADDDRAIEALGFNPCMSRAGSRPHTMRFSIN